uniref:Uncharacterized protein n=1 Tax=Anguilla anguilla TaxID=7936 RepID=A0A0E9WUC7_ANGAN
MKTSRPCGSPGLECETRGNTALQKGARDTAEGASAAFPGSCCSGKTHKEISGPLNGGLSLTTDMTRAGTGQERTIGVELSAWENMSDRARNEFVHCLHSSTALVLSYSSLCVSSSHHRPLRSPLKKLCWKSFLLSLV